MRILLSILGLLLSLIPTSLVAEEVSYTWSGNFVTLGEYRSDTDFSSIGPVYDVDGQEGGFLGLRFEPGLEIGISRKVNLHLRTEVRLGGGNLPSELEHHSPVSLLGKDLYLSYGADEGLQGEAGMRERVGASGLVLSQPVIGFSAGWKTANLILELWAAQVEENSPEGVNFRDDNFAADHWVGSFDLATHLGSADLRLNILGSRDVNLLMEKRTIGVVEAAVSQEQNAFDAWFSVALGGGNSEYGSLRTEEQALFFWGGEAGFEYRYSGARLGLNSLILSGDDQHDGNAHNGSFQWSGKSRSRTIILTEDERFRRNNSVGYALGNNRGPFREIQSGLHVSELTVGYGIESVGMEVSALGAVGSVLQGAYTGGDSDLGIETGLHINWSPAETLDVFIHSALVIPGSAAGYILNETNVDGKQSMWVLQLGTELTY